MLLGVVSYGVQATNRMEINKKTVRFFLISRFLPISDRKNKKGFNIEKELMEKNASNYFRFGFMPKLAALDLAEYYTTDIKPH